MDIKKIVGRLRLDFPDNYISLINSEVIDEDFTRITLDIDGKIEQISFRHSISDTIAELQKFHKMNEYWLIDAVYSAIKTQVECLIDKNKTLVE